MSESDRIESIARTVDSHSRAIWGGPSEGPGIDTRLDRLAELMTELTVNVTTLTTRVVGEAGIAIELRDVRRDLERMADEMKRKDEDYQGTLNDLHNKNQRRIDRALQIICAFAVPLVGCLVWLVSRSIYVMQNGVTIQH